MYGESRKGKIIFAIVLILVCAVISAVTGAASSLFIFNLLPQKAQNASTDSSQQVIYVTEEPSYLPEPETTTEPPTTEPPVTTTEPVTEKSKSDIYYEAVNSVVNIQSNYEVVIRGLFGTSFSRKYVSSGSGFFISDDGYLVTNYHVVKENQDLRATTYDGTEYAAAMVGYDENNDVAVLKINAETVPVTLGSSSDMTVGDDIMVIGNALGDLSYTFTDGLISYTNRRIQTSSGQTINMFQTNAAINSGNSGGPVYNMDGEVIGIASAKFASAEIEGLCFFIPIDDVKDKLFSIAYQY
ncbi:MAG: trypsin-like peptidase domain-containing protein [Clostridia bacterium]|nr:trypsin-like peptidase domain-containing protein [Clostridia bacterium]